MVTNPDNAGGLALCPFCGDYGAEVAESAVPSIKGGNKRAVYCNGCFCEGPTADTDEAAISAWNRRELCRAAPAGGDAERRFRGVGELERTGYIPAGSSDERDATVEVERQCRLHADIVEWEQRVDAGEISARELWTQVRPGLNTLRKLIRDSAPAGSGEVEQIAARLEDCTMRPDGSRIADDGEIWGADCSLLREAAAILRKLQQGADYVMVPRQATRVMTDAGRHVLDNPCGTTNAVTAAFVYAMMLRYAGMDWREYERTVMAPRDAAEIAASQSQEGGNG